MKEPYREPTRRQTTKTVASDTTAEVGDDNIGVDSSVGAFTVTLPTDIAVDGYAISVIDIGDNAGTNAITIATEGSATVAGGTTGSIGSNGDSILLVYIEELGDWRPRAQTTGGAL